MRDAGDPRARATDDELQTLARQLEEDLFKLRVQKATNQLENTNDDRAARAKDLARVQTVLSAREPRHRGQEGDRRPLGAARCERRGRRASDEKTDGDEASRSGAGKRRVLRARASATRWRRPWSSRSTHRVLHRAYKKYVTTRVQVQGPRREERVPGRRPGADRRVPAAQPRQALARAEACWSSRRSLSVTAAARPQAHVEMRHDPDADSPRRRRQLRRQEAHVHQGARRLEAQVRLDRRHHRRVREGGHPERQGEEGRGDEGGDRAHGQGDSAAGRLLHPLRRRTRRC